MAYSLHGNRIATGTENWTSIIVGLGSFPSLRPVPTFLGTHYSCPIPRTCPGPVPTQCEQAISKSGVTDTNVVTDVNVNYKKTFMRTLMLVLCIAGHFIAGLLYSGDVFLWHKDTDMLKFIHGLPALGRQQMQKSNAG